VILVHVFGVFYFDQLYDFGRRFGIGSNIGRLSETVPTFNFTHNVTSCPGVSIIDFPMLHNQVMLTLWLCRISS
jgi:hypothetical protein